MSNNRRKPNPDEIIIPDPGFNVILYKGECYRRSTTIGKVDTLPEIPEEGWQSCLECINVNPTPTPSPTYTLPAPAEVGFAKNITSHTENEAIDVEVYRWSGFGIPFEVDYEVVSLSATYGIDYLVEPAQTGTLIFEPSDNVKYIRLLLIQDKKLTELDELVHINLLEARPVDTRRTRAEIRTGKEMRVVQIKESGLPPPVTILPGDVVSLTATQFNYSFEASPGEDATIEIWADPPGSTFIQKYEVTIKNVAGNFVWDDLDNLSSRHVFTRFPESIYARLFDFAGNEKWYRITYAGPGSFRFHVERDVYPPAYEMILSAGEFRTVPLNRNEIDLQVYGLSAGNQADMFFQGAGTCQITLSADANDKLVFDVNGNASGPHLLDTIPQTISFTDCFNTNYNITLNYDTDWYRLRLLKY